MHIGAVYTRVQQVFADENGFFQIPFLLELLRLTQRSSNLWATHARTPAGPSAIVHWPATPRARTRHIAPIARRASSAHTPTSHLTAYCPTSIM
jgi:hypothetical protein